jgi:integrase
MATLSSIKGRRIVQVLVRDRRRTISLNRVSMEDARTIRDHIQRMARSVDWGVPASSETLRWLATISDKLHAKLSDAGLVEARIPSGSLQLDAYFTAYIKRRSDLKERSLTNLGQVQKFAVGFFGPTRELSRITTGDAKDWRRALAERYAEATIAMHVKRMRQLYADAIDRKLVTENPFRSVYAGTQSNPDRMYYVSRDDMAKVIEACPDAQWRLLFAMARYAGLRVPSEIRALKWSDIDFGRNRFTVQAAKTEHHVGKSRRTVPIFPELMPHLLSAQASAEVGEPFVFPRLRHQQLRTMAQKIIGRAGLTVWVKVFQNLRASCETDLAATNPLHLACAWIGNSTGVAMKHYLQVTDADYERAAKTDVSLSPEFRTSAEQEQLSSAELLEKLRVLVASIPPRGAEGVINQAESLQQAHKALQHALHSSKSYAGKTRRQLIENLRLAVDRAKGDR